MATIPRTIARDPDANYTPEWEFYRFAYRSEKGLRLIPIKDHEIGRLKPGTLVAFCDAELAASLASARRLKPLARQDACALVEVL
ncbi:MAG TPA: hypothetical protein VF655_03045 [Allosphingosinicella sp.]|jgi:hypothetical protein